MRLSRAPNARATIVTSWLTILLALGGALPTHGEQAASAQHLSESLPNGLRLSVVRDAESPLVATQLWYHVGSADEGDASRGLAHLFEHLMFGATTAHGPAEFAALHHRYGGYENAFTSPDETVYVSVLPPGPHLRVIEMEADRMRNLVHDAENLENEKKIVSEELRMRTENDPFSRLLVAAQSALLGAHPYAYDPGGTKEDVAAATLQSCRSFYDAYYHPNNAHLVVVGPVEPAVVREAVLEHFGPIPGEGVTPPTVPALDRWDYPAETTLREDLPPIETALVGFPLPPPEGDSFWALEVLRRILVGSAVNPFREDLVTRKGKALEAGVEWLTFRRGGAVVFYSASLPYRRKTTAFRAIDRSLERLAAMDWLTEASLSAAKKALVMQELRSRFYVASRADAIGRSRWWRGDESWAFERAERLERVTLDEVATVFRRFVVEPEPVRLYVKPEHVPWWIRAFGWLYPVVAP